MNANTSNIAMALIQGTTIRNKTAARVTGDKVGLTEYTAWTTALSNARMPFYKYAKALEDNAIKSAHGEELIDMNPLKDAAKPVLRTLLTVIGEVHGYKLHGTDELLEYLCKTALKDTDVLIGEALTVASQVANYKTQLKNGGNDEYIADVEEKLEAAEENLKELKKLPGSCKTEDGACSLTAFIKAMERRLGKVISKQYRKGWEQVQKEEEDKKAQAKANKKANRQRKRREEKSAAVVAA